MPTEIRRPILKDSKALVIGIANEHSIAYGCAKAFRELGADLAVTYLNEKARRFVEPLARDLEATIFLPLDVATPGALETQDCKSALPSQAVADDAEKDYAAALDCTDAATEAGCLRGLTTAQAAAVVGLGYELGGDRGPLQGVRLALSITNLFDSSPPYVNNRTPFSASGFDPENASPVGRMIAFQLVQGVAGSGGEFGDPWEAALRWQEQGAEWIHLVDLDAAFGRGSNAAQLADVLTGANPRSRYQGSKVYARLKVAGVEVASFGILDAEFPTDEVVQVFEDRRGVPVERLYVAKLLYGLVVLADEGAFPRGSTVAAVITGRPFP